MSMHNHKPHPLQKIRKNLNSSIPAPVNLYFQGLLSCSPISVRGFHSNIFRLLPRRMSVPCLCLNFVALRLLQCSDLQIPRLKSVSSNFSCMRITWYIYKLNMLIFRSTIEILNQLFSSRVQKFALYHTLQAVLRYGIHKLTLRKPAKPFPHPVPRTVLSDPSLQ